MSAKRCAPKLSVSGISSMEPRGSPAWRLMKLGLHELLLGQRYATGCFSLGDAAKG